MIRFDTYHDSHGKDRSVGALVASINQTFTKVRELVKLVELVFFSLVFVYRLLTYARLRQRPVSGLSVALKYPWPTSR